MTIPAAIVTGAGLRAVYLYQLDSQGRINATTTTFYGGVKLQGAKVLTNTVPQARRVAHTGDDRFLGYTVLPPNEGLTGELRTGKKNMTIDALLKGQAVIATGESKFHGVGTNRDGLEGQFCLLAYQAAEERDESSSYLGDDRWSSILIPKAKLYARQGSFDDNAYESAYDVTPYEVNKYPWLKAFALGTEVYTAAQLLEGVHQGKPRLLAALGDNTEDEFPFPTGVVAFDTSKVAVFLDGVARTTNITITTDKLTFTAPLPGVGVHIDVLLETT